MERRLPFAGAVNFRDLGGYSTADGRRVKWRKLFRCGHMADLTDADLAALSALDLHAICDFRSHAERAERPSRLPERLRSRWHHLEIAPHNPHRAEDDLRDLLDGAKSTGDLAVIVPEIYRAMIREWSGSYREMFARLLEAQGAPFLIHCVGGKDRTGIGSALILHSLGVPDETIVADYLLTKECAFLGGWLQSLIAQAATERPLTRAREELFAELMGLFGLSETWLQAAFETMAEQAGSVDAYVHDVLALDDPARRQLRSWYLEAA
jgi:protein-tyrosine phosphatase